MTSQRLGVEVGDLVAVGGQGGQKLNLWMRCTEAELAAVAGSLATIYARLPEARYVAIKDPTGVFLQLEEFQWATYVLLLHPEHGQVICRIIGSFQLEKLG